MLLGLLSVALLILFALPGGAAVLSLFSILAAIFAVILGIKSLRGNSNGSGIVGIVSGGLILALIAFGVILVLSTGLSTSNGFTFARSHGG